MIIFEDVSVTYSGAAESVLTNVNLDTIISESPNSGAMYSCAMAMLVRNTNATRPNRASSQTTRRDGGGESERDMGMAGRRDDVASGSSRPATTSRYHNVRYARRQ